MKEFVTVVPEFWKDFLCKADKCQHNCCGGWEIDIDEGTAAYYEAMEGELGERIRRHIQRTEEGCSFRLTEEGWCHFLRKDGLCQLILDAGEEILGNVCTMHPRFFIWLDRQQVELGGVGLCCEKSCELILKESGVLRFCEEDTENYFDFAELLNRLGLQIPKEEQCFSLDGSWEGVKSLLQLMAETEPIDEAWTKRIAFLEKHAEEAAARVKDYWKTADRDALQRVYQYIFYRVLDRVGEYEAKAVAEFARQNTEFICIEAAETGDLADAIRRWSEQIEYSTENVDLMLLRLSAK